MKKLRIKKKLNQRHKEETTYQKWKRMWKKMQKARIRRD